MTQLLYDELVSWYRLIDPVEEHADEAECFASALERAASPRPRTLLELGAGAGHNAFHLKARFQCTLTDLAEPMLELSRELNPGCEHLAGDMRSMRLGREFDAILVHDAILYMTTERDLSAVAETTFVHTRAGGAAVFAPDWYRESFEESTHLHEIDDGERRLRCIEWTRDPNPHDTTCTVDDAYLLWEGGEVRSLHDQHVLGLFPKEKWIRVLSDAGWRVEVFARPIGRGETSEVFLCRRS